MQALIEKRANLEAELKKVDADLSGMSIARQLVVYGFVFVFVFMFTFV